MMRHVGSPTVHLATEPVDMRKSINGLSVLIADHLECNPLNGSLFVFYNKARDKIRFCTGIVTVSAYGINGWRNTGFISLLTYLATASNSLPSNYRGCFPVFILMRFKAIRLWSFRL